MLPPELAQRLQALRDRFETGWKAGSPPPMEELLAEMPEEGLPALLTELLRIECRYGGGPAPAGRGRPPSPAPAPAPPAAPAPAPAVDSVFDARFPASPTPGNGPPRPHPPPLPSVPGYEVQENPPHGGMGVISRARHGRLNMPVALKM